MTRKRENTSAHTGSANSTFLYWDYDALAPRDISACQATGQYRASTFS